MQNYVNFHAGLGDPIVYVYINRTSSVTCCGYSNVNNFTIAAPDTNSLRNSDTNLFLSFDSLGSLKGYAITDSSDAA